MKQELADSMEGSVKSQSKVDELKMKIKKSKGDCSGFVGPTSGQITQLGEVEVGPGSISFHETRAMKL